MAFEYWHSLSDAEKMEIVTRAAKTQDTAKRFICFWCGSPLNGRYDYTSNEKGKREICKGVCKARRFFDNPDRKEFY